MIDCEVLELRVTARRMEAEGIISIELRDVQGRPLPAFAPGAHLEVTLISPSAGEHGLIRHYSLCNSSAETHRYVVAVALARNTRGGSRAMHEMVQLGSALMVRPPRNNFPLVENAAHYRFIAGGIGITPILSMVKWCEAQGKSWSLLYCARSRHCAAFREELEGFGDRVRFHFDAESSGRLADLNAELARGRTDEHVYCCGPEPLMLAVEAAAARRPAGSVHFEWFSARDVAHAPTAPADTFHIVLKRSGLRLRVPPDKSVLETLEDNGISVAVSCREGVCRTCETPLCAGEADHRDWVLSEEERRAQRSMIICVSRAKTPELELDI